MTIKGIWTKAARFALYAGIITAVVAFMYKFPVPKDAPDYISSALLAAAGTIIMTALGRKITRSGYTVSFAAGTAVFGTVIFIMGLLGMAGLPAMLALALVTTLAVTAEIQAMANDAAAAVRSFTGRKHGTGDAAYYAVATGAGLYLLATCLTPPVYYDSLVYHLGAAQQYIYEGKIVNLPENIFSYFPQLASMLYMFFLSLSGELSVKLFLFATALFTAAAVYGLSKSRAAVLLALTSTLFVLNASRASAELFMAFYALAAFIYIKENKQGFGAAVTAGLIAGAAAGVKYNGIIITAFGILYLIFNTGKTKEKIGNAAGFLLGAGAVILPYLLRNMMFTGNPVYPFMTAVFGPAGMAAADAQNYVAHVAGFGMKKGIVNFLLSPAFAVFRRDMFGGDILSPLVPAVMLAYPFSRPKGSGPAALFLYAYFALWFLTAPVLRFLLPAELAAAVVAGAMIKQEKNRIAVITAALFILAQSLMTVYFTEKYLEPLKIFTATRADYIRGKITYAKACDFIKEQLDHKGMKVLFLGEAQTFYSPVRSVAYTVFNSRPFIDGCEADKGAGFMAEIKKQGITHILVNRTELYRLRDSGYDDIYKAMAGQEYKNMIDKNFHKIYIDYDCDIYELKGWRK